MEMALPIAFKLGNKKVPAVPERSKAPEWEQISKIVGSIPGPFQQFFQHQIAKKIN